MFKPIRRVASHVAALILGVTLAPTMATAEDEIPAGDLHAFAVQGDSCENPGYIHINEARGVTWTIGGEPVEVTYPSSRFYFPHGIQEDVTATALPGYRIDPGVKSVFYLTVNRACMTQPDPEQPQPEQPPVTEEPPECAVPDDLSDELAAATARADRLQQRVDAKTARIQRLRERLRDLRDRR